MNEDRSIASKDLDRDLQKSKDEISLMTTQAVCSLGLVLGLGYAAIGFVSAEFLPKHIAATILAGACLITRTIAVGLIALLRQSK